MSDLNNLLSSSVQSVIIFSNYSADSLVDIISKNISTNKGDILFFDPGMGVEELRKTLGSFFLKPVDGDRRILFVDNADNLNREQSNTLLKTIEEPPKYGRVVLSARNKAKIIDTILSRTYQVYLTDNKIDDRSELMDDISELSFRDFSKKVKSIERQEAVEMVRCALENIKTDSIRAKVDLFKKISRSLIRLDSSNVNYKLVLESIYIHNKITK